VGHTSRVIGWSAGGKATRHLRINRPCLTHEFIFRIVRIKGGLHFRKFQLLLIGRIHGKPLRHQLGELLIFDLLHGAQLQ
jgi:hypothetical protein